MNKWITLIAALIPLFGTQMTDFNISVLWPTW